MSYTDRLTDAQSQDFANKVGDIFKSVPHLPKEWVAFLVKIAPVMAIIGAVLSIFAGPVIGLAGVVSLLSFNPILVLSLLLSAILSLVGGVILFLAYKPLQERKYDGWMLLFWSQVLGFVSSLVGMIGGHNNLIGAIIGLAIGMYILFEMRSSYGVKGKVEALKAEVKKLA